MGAFLEPSLYQRLNENDRRSARKLIANEMELIHLPASVQSSSGHVDQTKITNKFDLFTRLCGLSGPMNRTVGKILTIDEEISHYVKAVQAGDDFQAFWCQYRKKFTRLSSIVRRINVIPATSVPSEAAFSIAGYINRKQRSSLSPMSIRYSMVLKDRHLIDKLKRTSSTI